MKAANKKLPRWTQLWWVWFAIIFAITFLSFWPSFFSAIVNVEVHIIIHGVSATAWMLLTVVQALMLKGRWRKYHRKVGYISLGLAAIVVLSGLQVLQTMVLREGTATLTMIFFYIDITGLVLFCVFLWLAVKAARRRDIPLHLRLITCTAIIPLEAVLERTYLYGIPSLVPDFGVALMASEITLLVLMTALVVGEWWYGRLRWPFAALLTYYVVMMLTQDMIAGAAWFQSAAVSYANF